MSAQRFRKKALEIDAMQFDGANHELLNSFTGGIFGLLSPDDRECCDDPEAVAEVFDKLHSTWVLVYPGDWIICGVKGEFYPCRPDVFADTYEAVP